MIVGLYDDDDDDDVIADCQFISSYISKHTEKEIDRISFWYGKKFCIYKFLKETKKMKK